MDGVKNMTIYISQFGLVVEYRREVSRARTSGRCMVVGLHCIFFL
jgi:hypothetical protein